jgi:hypothetical protein
MIDAFIIFIIQAGNMDRSRIHSFIIKSGNLGDPGLIDSYIIKLGNKGKSLIRVW